MIRFQNTYFTHQLPLNSIVYLSEKDDIVNAPLVLDYLVKHSHPTRKIVYIENFTHGQIIASPRALGVIQEINSFKYD